MAIALKSTAFEEGGMIPAHCSYDGKNTSPPLSWSGVPERTKSLALIVDDPDAPAGTWVHWVLYNLPETLTQLGQGIPPQKTLDNGARQGTNDFGKTGYGGPCPPAGTHRYFFKLYALDTALELPAGATKAQLVEAMKGHVLAEAQLMGRYKR